MNGWAGMEKLLLEIEIYSRANLDARAYPILLEHTKKPPQFEETLASLLLDDEEHEVIERWYGGQSRKDLRKDLHEGTSENCANVRIWRTRQKIVRRIATLHQTELALGKDGFQRWGEEMLVAPPSQYDGINWNSVKTFAKYGTWNPVAIGMTECIARNLLQNHDVFSFAQLPSFLTPEYRTVFGTPTYAKIDKLVKTYRLDGYKNYWPLGMFDLDPRTPPPDENHLTKALSEVLTKQEFDCSRMRLEQNMSKRHISRETGLSTHDVAKILAGAKEKASHILF